MDDHRNLHPCSLESLWILACCLFSWLGALEVRPTVGPELGDLVWLLVCRLELHSLGAVPMTPNGWPQLWLDPWPFQTWP